MRERNVEAGRTRGALLAILVCAGMAGQCLAFVVNKGIWQLSETVTNAVLYERLSQVEAAAGKDNSTMAEQKLQQLLDEGLAGGYVSDDGEPLELSVRSAMLWYRAERLGNNSPEVVKEARSAIDSWRERARGRQWKSYKYLYHRIRAFYVVQKDQSGRIETQKEMMLYDPFDVEQVKSLEEYCIRFPEQVGDMPEFIAKFKKAGGTLTSSFELTLITSSSKSAEEKLEEVLNWLKRERDGDLDTLKAGVQCALRLTSMENGDSVRKLYVFLSDLALWQPANEERLAVIAFLLNERGKIRAVAQDVLK